MYLSWYILQQNERGTYSELLFGNNWRKKKNDCMSDSKNDMRYDFISKRGTYLIAKIEIWSRYWYLTNFLFKFNVKYFISKEGGRQYHTLKLKINLLESFKPLYDECSIIRKILGTITYFATKELHIFNKECTYIWNVGRKGKKRGKFDISRKDPFFNQ